LPAGEGGGGVSKPLVSFTDDELLEEIIRRRNARDRDGPEVKWCDECRRFVPWRDGLNVPENYNPCANRHAMKFRSPAGYNAPFGFYRTLCPDRQEIGEATG